MRVFLLVVFLFTGFAAVAGTDAGGCYSVPDHDARTLCLARARGDVGMCYAISDPGMRSACLAELRR